MAFFKIYMHLHLYFYYYYLWQFTTQHESSLC